MCWENEVNNPEKLQTLKIVWQGRLFQVLVENHCQMLVWRLFGNGTQWMLWLKFWPKVGVWLTFTKVISVMSS